MKHPLNPRLFATERGCNDSVIPGSQHTSITLRDLFAMHALQAILTSPEHRGLNEEESTQAAYSLADAMLKAREAK